MRRAFVSSIAIALSSLGLAAQVRAAAVSASAWSYETNDTHASASAASALIDRQGPNAPGESHARASGVYGAVAAFSSIRGCGFDYNNFQQVCNEAGGHGEMNDTLFVTSDLPDSWELQARATLRLSGEVNGHGGYSYATLGGIPGQYRSITGTTSGTVQLLSHQSIADTRVWDITLNSGYAHPISLTVDTYAYQRYCAGGSSDCFDSANNWTIDLGASSTLQIEILTPGIHAHLSSASGHDYTQATAGAASERSGETRLGPAYPNPARGEARLALTLAEATDVDAGVFDITGRRIATLAHGRLSPGPHTLTWDHRDGEVRAPSGLYLVRARGAGFDVTRRIIVTR